jgi:hypothetical protein
VTQMSSCLPTAPPSCAGWHGIDCAHRATTADAAQPGWQPLAMHCAACDLAFRPSGQFTGSHFLRLQDGSSCGPG